jgi:nitroreductase
MNILEAIETRRSIKHYDPSHVMPQADVDRLLELACLAPSSFNMQNYRFGWCAIPSCAAKFAPWLGIRRR